MLLTQAYNLSYQSVYQDYQSSLLFCIFPLKTYSNILFLTPAAILAKKNPTIIYNKENF